MKRLCGITVLIVVLVAAGCARQEPTTQDASKGSPKTASGSSLDEGPRAAAEPMDAKLAAQGEQLFKDKGCSACHTFGRKLSGPDLQGVTMRRTALWMENQILHPEVMTKQDPISRQLFAQFSLEMPNQGLTPDEARAVIEFLKHKDHEASEGQEAKKEDEK